MVFKRYSSPFLFLDNLLEQGCFYEGIDTLFNQVEEEKMWQLYLSIPIKEKSYIDWKNEVLQPIEQPIVRKKNLEVAKKEAKEILKNFKPY